MSESTQTPAPKVDAEGNVTLKRSMGPVQLWALAVGLVISGNFFGWSYGYAAGGPLGLLIACIPVTIFFATFILCYSEMATMLPSAGGGSIYARKAFGPFAGYCAGISSLVELMFAPPAIALAVGGYIHNLIPAIPAIPATIIVFIFFVMVNWLGMHTSAIFELIVTVVALVGLCIFWAAATPHFEMSNFLKPLAETNGFSGFLQYIPGGWKGILAATPYAIWFYLALEGGAVSAEEMNNPQKDIPKGFLTGMGTLFVMMCLTCVLTAGIADYTQVSAVDFPLPAALGIAYGEGSVITLVVNILGLFGLIASLNGIVAASSRQVYAMGRTGYLPKFFAGLNKKHRTPTAALWTAGIVGIITACTGLTNIVISISAFGLVFLYAISLCAYMKLKKTDPDYPRPFKAPAGMVLAVISLIICLYCIFAMIVTATGVSFPEGSLMYMIFGPVQMNALVATIVIYAVAFLWYALKGRKDLCSFDEEIDRMAHLD
jgi:ethanolamine permease